MRIEKSYTSVCFIKYRPALAWLGFMSMAVFRFPLWFRKDVRFFKLMGCGKGGSFDFHPDWQQWAIIVVHSNLLMPNQDELPRKLYGKFISDWIRNFHCESRLLILESTDGHGQWDGKYPFSFSNEPLQKDESVAVLTRASIRFGKLRAFWKNAAVFNQQMIQKDGLQFSIGFGEMPFLKQATFSIWKNAEFMKTFAYQSEDHRRVIQRTRTEGWYSEEMFVRFRVVSDQVISDQ